MPSRAQELLEDVIDDYRYDLGDPDEVLDTVNEDAIDGWGLLVASLAESSVEVAIEDVEKLRAVAELLEIDDEALSAL